MRELKKHVFYTEYFVHKNSRNLTLPTAVTQLPQAAGKS